MWGAFYLKLQAFLEEGLPAGSKRDEGLREINTFLVEKGMLAPEDKARFDAETIATVNYCCVPDRGLGNGSCIRMVGIRQGCRQAREKCRARLPCFY